MKKSFDFNKLSEIKNEVNESDIIKSAKPILNARVGNSPAAFVPGIFVFRAETAGSRLSGH